MAPFDAVTTNEVCEALLTDDLVPKETVSPTLILVGTLFKKNLSETTSYSKILDPSSLTAVVFDK